LQSEGTLDRYVPVDVSDSALVELSAVAEEYPGLKVRGVVADFEAHLDQLPTDGRRLVAFLGGTIGTSSQARARTSPGSPVHCTPVTRSCSARTSPATRPGSSRPTTTTPG
jgi:hypothetical protein